MYLKFCLQIYFLSSFFHCTFNGETNEGDGVFLEGHLDVLVLRLKNQLLLSNSKKVRDRKEHFSFQPEKKQTQNHRMGEKIP